MKKVLAALMMATLVLAGCGAKEGGDSKSLVVYSPNSEGLIASTIPAFEEKYGIKVDLIQAGTGELFTKMNSEASNPVADVMFGGAYSTFTQNEHLFEPYTSPNNDNVMDAYKNKTGYITPYVLDGSVLIVNNSLIGDLKIEGYADLLNPALKGKIATADPASSSSAFAQLTNMLLAMGGYEDEGAWKYVKDLFTNIDGKIASGSSNVYKSVADGELVVGLTYEDPSVALLNNGADVSIIYPKEGAVFLPAGSAIIKNAKNMENAKLFIDFIISQEIQDVYGTETTNRPVLKEVKTSDTMIPMSEINTIEEDIDYVREHKDEMVEKYKQIFAEIESGK
jgi:iron(III) transport system substrate-binding protein